MSATIGEFFIDLVVDSGKGELTIGNLVSSMGALEVASIGEIAILSELAKSLEKVTADSISTTLGLRDYESATGASTEALQRWQSVARHVDEGQNVQKVFEYITQSLTAGQKAGGDYGNLKNLLNYIHDINLSLIDPKHPQQLAEMIRASKDWHNMMADPNLQSLVMGSSGIGGILRTLQMEQTEFQEDWRNAPIIPKRDVANYDAIHKDFISLEEAATRIRQVIAHWFTGDVEKSLHEFVKVAQHFAAFIDNRNAKVVPRDKATQKMISSLESSWNPEYKVAGYLADFNESILRKFLSGHLPKNESIGEAIGSVPAMVSAGASKVITMSPTYHVKVDGSKLGPNEMVKAIEDAFIRVNTEILNLVNRAAT